MNRLQELIASLAAKPSVIVHLGAGACKDYESYQSVNPSRIIFVEPDQHQSEKTRNKFRHINNVTIIDRAIAAQNERRLLNITNNRNFSSLLSPADLLDFYPNIAITNTVEVEAITLDNLCLDMEIGNATDNLLVAELQGMEKEIFPTLTNNTLHKFRWIIIRSSEHNLYKPASTKLQDDLPQVMRDASYMVLVFKEEAPPFINILCIKNEAYLDNALLLDQARAQVQSLTAHKEAQRAKITDLTKSLKEKSREIAKLQQTLKDNNKRMLKSDADMKDLQIQYRTVLQRQEQQHALLLELKVKLKQASELYQKLNLKNLVPDGDFFKQDNSDTTEALIKDNDERPAHK